MLKNFLFSYSYKLKSSNLVEELCECKLKKAVKVIRFALLLTYTPISSCAICACEVFPLPSSSLLQKINGTTDAAKCVQTFRRLTEKDLRISILVVG